LRPAEEDERTPVALERDALRVVARHVAFERRDAAIPDARPERQRRGAESTIVEGYDPGERIPEDQAKNLLLALRRKDVRARGHAAPPARASTEYRRP
jgi:hypothetical protein